jgi:RNA polymerase sigma-70 factor (ECF subfamily)
LSLLAKVRSRDKQAWDRLVSLYTPLVDSWCRLAYLQEADAADVRQEVFMAVTRNIAEFHRDQTTGTFRGWLRTIFRSKLNDHWKKVNKGGPVETGGSDAYRRLLQIPSPSPELLNGAAADEEEECGLLYRRAVELLLTDFEERSRRAFWAVVVDGRPPRDVAADLGISANAVYLIKARVLSKLREEFEGLLED